MTTRPRTAICTGGTEDAPRTAIIRIDAIPPSLNEWSRWHWAKRYTLSGNWKALVRHASRGTPMFKVPVIVTVEYHFADRRRRDYDNYTPKFLLDGMKGVIIPDDNSAWITELRLRFAALCEREATVVTVEVANA